ncbi:N,N-dimethylformamidase beta subunit family domain-containing protein, partial [Bradyrhizobium ottawaense]
MDVGHDEYWTDSQFSNVQAAGRAGVNLMFLSGNEVYWQTRLAPSIDASQTANRTLISYKDTHANQLIDPTGTATGTFMDARFASTGGLSGIPSNALTGQVFQVDS